MVATILACGLLASVAPAMAESLPPARDFSSDARRAATQRVPILVLFSRPDCAYCDRVKDEYLLPMLKDPAYKNKVMIRELDITSLRPLVLFDKRASSGSAFADALKISLVPTIMVFDANGKPVAEPIVGLLIPDYYFGYIDAAINAGLQALRADAPAVR